MNSSVTQIKQVCSKSMPFSWKTIAQICSSNYQTFILLQHGRFLLVGHVLVQAPYRSVVFNELSFTPRMTPQGFLSLTWSQGLGGDIDHHTIITDEV